MRQGHLATWPQRYTTLLFKICTKTVTLVIVASALSNYLFFFYWCLQVLEGKPYNRKCDVYSFGICLWEIYCCDMPYPDLSFADVSSAVVHQVCFHFLDSLLIIIHILNILGRTDQ